MESNCCEKLRVSVKSETPKAETKSEVLILNTPLTAVLKEANWGKPI